MSQDRRLTGEPGQAEIAETARLIPNANLVTIEAGHHIHTAKPDEFTSAVVTFLTE